ncbi:MAG TPA: hypothetical protein VNB24_10135 [Acidimicrobiales bacterium]|nr:hypothetical protein [Acidimicrobiales bacterium]
MKRIALAASIALIAAAFGVSPARAAETFPNATFSGSATGTVVHTDALNSGTTRIENADVALSSAAVNSRRLTTQAVNENNRVVNPALPAKSAYAKGQGLEVGLATTPPADGQILLAGKAEASAPPTGPTVTREQAVKVEPAAFASLVRGRADARWNDDTCILGTDMTRGLGYAADVQLVDTGQNTKPDEFDAPLVALDDTDPARAVSQSVSRNKLVPNADGSFGLLSEVRETIAPVTLFKGAANQLTIEVLGEWVLRAVATGSAGPANEKLFYGPADTTPQTPILRITNGLTAPTTTVLTFQQVFGAAGFTLPPLDAVAEIAIGEDPRAIGGNAATTPVVAADGTQVAAAVDVVRLRLAGGAVGDIRIGHMEVKATVPAGGVICPIPVTKKATPSTVNETTAPDGKFQVAITIRNPFDCPLINVKAVDVISRKTGDVTFEIVKDDARNDPKSGVGGTTFTNTSPTSATATYPNLGTLAPGETRVLNLVIDVLSGGGEIQDIVTVDGVLNCADARAQGEARATAALRGTFTLVTRANAILPRTGGDEALLWLGIPLAALLVVRRLTK